MLIGDMRYLYYGKNSFNVSWLNILINYCINWLQALVAPLFFLPMVLWLCISTFQVVILWVYMVVLTQNKSTPEQEEIDIYY